MESSKALAASDMTIGEADALHAIALRTRNEAGDNEWAIWALLLSYPRRIQDQLAQVWGVRTLGDVARGIAMGRDHG